MDVEKSIRDLNKLQDEKIEKINQGKKYQSITFQAYRTKNDIKLAKLLQWKLDRFDTKKYLVWGRWAIEQSASESLLDWTAFLFNWIIMIPSSPCSFSAFRLWGGNERQSLSLWLAQVVTELLITYVPTMCKQKRFSELSSVQSNTASPTLRNYSIHWDVWADIYSFSFTKTF